MSTVEIRSVINSLVLVRENSRLPQYLDTEQAQSIRALRLFLDRLNKGELEIRKITSEQES